MSESEYGRLAAQLTEVLVKLSAMEEKLTNYAEVKAQVANHEIEIRSVKQRCESVQDSKKKWSINWGAVWGTVVGAVIIALIFKFAKL